MSVQLCGLTAVLMIEISSRSCVLFAADRFQPLLLPELPGAPGAPDAAGEPPSARLPPLGVPVGVPPLTPPAGESGPLPVAGRGAGPTPGGPAPRLPKFGIETTRSPT